MQNTANFPSQCDRRALKPLIHNVSRNVPRTRIRTTVSNCARQRYSATPDSNLPEAASNLPKTLEQQRGTELGSISNEPQAAARSRWRADCPRSCWCSPRRARRRRAPPWRPAAPPSQPSSPSSSPSHSARPPQTAEDNEHASFEFPNRITRRPLLLSPDAGGLLYTWASTLNGPGPR